MAERNGTSRWIINMLVTILLLVISAMVGYYVNATEKDRGAIRLEMRRIDVDSQKRADTNARGIKENHDTLIEIKVVLDQIRQLQEINARAFGISQKVIDSVTNGKDTVKVRDSIP